MKLAEYMKRFASPALAAALALGCVASVNAQKWLFDLGGVPTDFRSIPAPSPDPNGNHWNVVGSCCFFPDLVDKAGNVTTVDFGFSGAAGNDSYNGPAGPTDPPPYQDYLPNTDIDAAALGDLGVKEAAFDYYTGATMQIQSLDPSKKYTVTFFGSHQYNDDNDITRYTSYTDGTFTTAISSVDLVVGGNGFWNRDKVAKLNAISPQADGILYLGFRGVPRGAGYLNSMSVEVVPEPSALALLCGGVATIGALRRKK
jgi:hypothetical protein